ncbi:MAG: ABC transporter permease [Candidatus Borkfalkia sp.]
MEKNSSLLLKRPKFKDTIVKYWPLYLMFLPVVVLLVLFNYLPMYGIVLAFKDYWPQYGILGSPWMTPLFSNFSVLFADEKFWDVTKNTLIISALRLVFGFPAPILLALFFNEIRSKTFKKVSQTILYLPYFLSWVILAGMLRTMLLSDGIVNDFLGKLGLGPYPFLSKSSLFLPMLIVTDIWKNMGFGSIIYLAAIMGIDSSLYEASLVDGANRFQRMVHITLPGIVMAISINLILSLSGILNGGFDQIFNLYSVPVYDVADIIDTYVYRIGITDGEFGIATALGLIKSVIGFALILIVNKVTNKLGGVGVW